MQPILWTCPLCHCPLQPVARRLRCQRNHCFDVAKEGYVNLLLAHQKRSSNPGDDKQMLTSRREFLGKGYYRPLLDHLTQQCLEVLAEASGAVFSLLDTGCGEGHYSGLIAAALEKAEGRQLLWIGAIDVSKEAVRMAAKRHKTVQFAVASNASIPVGDHRLDCVLRIFAPVYGKEIVRVLKPMGQFISVAPGPRHLYALRRLVYDEPREHSSPIVPIPGLKHSERVHLDFELTLADAGDTRRLLSMTPYYWHTSRFKQYEIAMRETLTTEVSFVIDRYRATQGES